MTPGKWLQAVVATLSGALWLEGAGAGAQAPIAARLQGTFVLSGLVTVAVHVRGERPGQPISRTWTFAPQCPAGPCSTVTLTRGRTGGTDTLALHGQASGSYSGSGRFYAPLRCGGRVHQRGELVPFTVTVRITATTEPPAGPVATSIAASYTNPKRENLTRCVLPPSRDAAVYTGQLEAGS